MAKIKNRNDALYSILHLIAEATNRKYIFMFSICLCSYIILNCGDGAK